MRTVASFVYIPKSTILSQVSYYKYSIEFRLHNLLSPPPPPAATKPFHASTYRNYIHKACQLVGAYPRMHTGSSWPRQRATSPLTSTAWWAFPPPRVCHSFACSRRACFFRHAIICNENKANRTPVTRSKIRARHFLTRLSTYATYPLFQHPRRRISLDVPDSRLWLKIVMSRGSFDYPTYDPVPGATLLSAAHLSTPETPAKQCPPVHYPPIRLAPSRFC